MQLISPDGKTTREVSKKDEVGYTFSADGKTIYGVRRAAGALELFSTSVAGGGEKTIGSMPIANLPTNSLSPALRLSRTPDGSSLTFSTASRTANLWLVDGLKSIIQR